MAPTRSILAASLLLLSLPLLGCRFLQGDYAKPDTALDVPTFAPLASHKTPAPSSLSHADDLALARFAPDSEPLASIDLRLRPADFTGDRRFDGFDVTLTPLDALSRPVKTTGGLILELYRFDPDVLSSLGDKLLVWTIPEPELLPAWARHQYHFRLSWWPNKPVRENFYVVMVATFVDHQGAVFTRTKAPVRISQPRYEKP